MSATTGSSVIDTAGRLVQSRHRAPPALLALVVAVLGASMVACANTSIQPARSPGPTTAGPAGFPVTVQNCGRSLTFQQPPSRVVTGYQPVFEDLVALGLGDRIIGRLNFSENGPNGFLPGQKAVYDKIPEISDMISFPPKEVMLAQRPDFVISEDAENFNASDGVATIQQLNDTGTPVFITGNWCNVLADIADDFVMVSAEQIAASRPDALLVLDYATLFGKDQPSAQTKADSAFRIAANSPVARQRRFFPVPAAAAHSGYRNLLEIREIARFLHPDAFS